jgi:adenosylcobinamide-GDP ribazoletransferase
MRGLTSAIRTLTRLPAPGGEAASLGEATPWFPIVGFLLGVEMWLASAIWTWATGGSWPEGAALAIVAGGLWVTRGLHLDGLADMADGFGGGTDRESALRIMKDPRKGSFGVMAIALAVLAKWAALTHLIGRDGVAWVPVAMTVSRFVMADLVAAFPYARREGGMAAPFFEGASRDRTRLALAGAVVAIAVVPLPGWARLLALAMGWVGARAFGRYCRRRVGGLTGDLLGAACELTETGILVGGAIWA